MKILIIGGTGVLSSAVSAEAIKQGINVTMLNRGRRKIPAGVELIIANKDDYKAIDAALKGRQFDAIIDFLCSDAKDVSASFILYSKFTKHYFFISSCAVYATKNNKPCTENSPKIEPDWEYSIRKWIAECRLNKLAQKNDTHITIIRPCITYDNTRIPYGIAPKYGFHWTLAARILAGKPIIRWNGGDNICNMLRVEDFAVGVVGLLGNPQAYGETFNICGDETPSFNEVLEIVGEYLGIKPIVFDVSSEDYAREIPSRAGEILGGRSVDTIISNDKIKEVVPGFKQTIGIKEGIAKTLDAYKELNYQYGIDWRFDAETDRIIVKQCKKANIPLSTYKTSFVDYLGNATNEDKKIYNEAFNKPESLLRKERCIRKIKSFLRKVYIYLWQFNQVVR